MKRAFIAVAILLASPAAVADMRDGMLHLRRGEPDRAYEQFRKAAEGGDSMAARALGFLLHAGVEVRGGGALEARPEEAAKWFRQAAEAGDKVSADWLAVILFAGRGVPRDAPQALQWFRKAGQDVDAQLKTVEAFPEADRAELAAWPLALRVAMGQASSRIGRRKSFRAGEAEVIIDPLTGKARAGKVEEPRLGELAIELADEALTYAPPPPAAVRHKYEISYVVDFRHF